MEATIKALKARANAHNLAVYVDKNTDSFYIADRATNSVIAPPPMCLEAVAEWLDNYEKEAAKEVVSALWYNMNVVQALF